MFAYQKKQVFFAQLASGMEEVGIRELTALGAEQIRPGFRGLYFRANPAGLYKINYQSRFMTRVLAPLISFDCPDEDMLYHKTREIRWYDLFSVGDTFAVFANVSDSRINHSKYAALKVKDAIVDGFRSRYNFRPNVDAENPDLWINLHIHENKAILSLDTSGGSLHRRGYRKIPLESPMQETLAAAVVELSGWDETRPLADPMCGSGTLLSEALMRYCRIPAGYLRSRFGFEYLPDYDEKLWRSVKKQADQEIRALPSGLIFGSDIRKKAVEAAITNNVNLPYGNVICLEAMPFQQIQNLEKTLIVCNPPYGIRMGKDRDMGELMGEFGDFLKQKCKGSTAYVYFGDRELIKKMGLKPSWKKPLTNGGLDGRLVKYEMY